VVGLYSATGVNPDLVVSVLFALLASAFDLRPSSLRCDFSRDLDVLMCDFIPIPGMRKNSIRWDGVRKMLEFLVMDVE